MGCSFIHLRTLGVGPAAEANGGPPLAELLFAAEVLDLPAAPEPARQSR